MKSIVKGIVLAALIASPAMVAREGAAAETEFTKAGGYSSAGCGLGGMVLGSKKQWYWQTLASFLNGLFGNQTFAITTGTSGCEAGLFVGEASTRMYVETNREILQKDIARGSGETLAALAQVAGCADASAMSRSLQAQYSTLFPSAQATDTQVSAAVAVSQLRRTYSLYCHTKAQPFHCNTPNANEPCRSSCGCRNRPHRRMHCYRRHSSVPRL